MAACASGPSGWLASRELLEAVLSESGYIEALEAERTIEAEGRVENLQELVGVARGVRRQPRARGRVAS